MPSATPSWLVEARQAVDRAGDEKQFQDRLDHLVDVDDDLSRLLSELEELTVAAKAGLSSWWNGADIPANILTGLATLRKTIGPRQWASTRRGLDQLLPKVKTEIRSAWQNYVAQLAGNADDLQNLVRVLGTAPGLADVASDLDSALGELTRLRRKLPDAQSMTAVQAAAKLLDELAGRLPREVKEFVSAAARGGGAPLDLLNAEVWTWLSANGAAGEFRIVVAGKGRGQARG